MKKRFMVSCLSALVLSTPVWAGTGLNNGVAGQKIVMITDKVGSNMMKFLSDAPLEKIAGTAKGVSGQFTLDASNLEATTGTITVQVMSMKSGVSKRDEHMYDEEWLDAEKFPTITFQVLKLEGVQVTSDNGITIKAQAVGKFTLHGVSKEMKIPITMKYVKESEATKKRAAGDLVMINANFSVALKDYNVKGKGGIVGSKVGETIQLEAALFGATGEK
jgi:polyisoprenoid-binding protein YceI